jgi:hypothetical protein
MAATHMTTVMSTHSSAAVTLHWSCGAPQTLSFSEVMSCHQDSDAMLDTKSSKFLDELPLQVIIHSREWLVHDGKREAVQRDGGSIAIGDVGGLKHGSHCRSPNWKARAVRAHLQTDGAGAWR